jgi:hypothetical protein
MAEPAPQQLARLQSEVQSLEAQIQGKLAAPKDLSLVTPIPKWGGTEKALPLNEFFDAIEGSAHVGN